jgi:LysR family transcriptional regulator, transcription activator of glutamate synthase operon
MHYGPLEYIIEVARTKSISEAALNLHVSVATVSESISKFEKSYGIKLFNRSRSGTVPTDEGKEIIEKAFEIQNKFLELDRVAKSFTSVTEKKLTLICSSSLLQSLLPKALSTFKKKYPDVKIEIKEHPNNHPTIIEELKKNETDIGFITEDENTWIEWEKLYKHIIHFDTLFQGRVYVCVNKASPLSFKDSISPEELLDQTLVLYANTRRIYDDLVKQYGKIKVLFESHNTEIIKNMVEEGLAITLWSDLSIKNDPRILNGQIIPIPLVNQESSNVTYGWAHLKKRKLSPVAKNFLKTLRLEISNGDF